MEIEHRKILGNQKGQSIIEVTIFGFFFASLLFILQLEATAHKDRIEKFKNKGFKYENRVTR